MASRTALFTASALALVAGAFGHARLVTPKPWNTQPTKNAPCGGSAKLPATVTWVRSQQATIDWELIAGDGAGPVTITFDLTGSANPPASELKVTVPNVVTTTANSLRVYSGTFTVPADLVCPDDGCTMQVASAGWVSCTTVKVSSAASADGQNGASTTCQNAENLSFCSMMNGRSVRAATGANLAELDQQAENAYSSNLASPLVFNTPNADACKASYKNYVCFDVFPLCELTAGVCQSACNEMTGACSLKEEHANLYKCSSAPTSSCMDASVIAGCCSPGQSFGIFLLVVVILALVGFIGAMVYWRSHDRAKYDRVKAKPSEWVTSIKGWFGY